MLLSNLNCTNIHGESNECKTFEEMTEMSKTHSSNIVSRDEWLKARLELLKKEKSLTKTRDELTHARQNMPWVKVEKDYVFDGSDGKTHLHELFEGKSQLIVYHFMFDPDWDVGCKSCSSFADQYDPTIIHLAQRDVTMVTISKAPLEKLDAFKKRMGWKFKWLSSFNSDFNSDFHVSFTDDEIAGKANYNFEENTTFPEREAPGMSIFALKDGQVYHTYSVYARGMEDFLTVYRFLDVVPKGRDEDNLSFGMDWIKLKDNYAESP